LKIKEKKIIQMVVCAFRKTKQCQKVKKEELWLFFSFFFNTQAQFSKKPVIIFSSSYPADIMGKTLFKKDCNNFYAG
jgi:hypothetical protein